MRAADDPGDSPREGDSLCRWGTRFREAPAYGRSADDLDLEGLAVLEEALRPSLSPDLVRDVAVVRIANQSEFSAFVRAAVRGCHDTETLIDARTELSGDGALGTGLVGVCDCYCPGVVSCCRFVVGVRPGGFVDSSVEDRKDAPVRAVALWFSKSNCHRSGSLHLCVVDGGAADSAMVVVFGDGAAR